MLFGYGFQNEPCSQASSSYSSLFLLLQVHQRASLSGYITDHVITHYVFCVFFGMPDIATSIDPGSWTEKTEETLRYVMMELCKAYLNFIFSSHKSFHLEKKKTLNGILWLLLLEGLYDPMEILN